MFPLLHAPSLLRSVRFCLVVGLLAGLTGSCAAVDLVPNASSPPDAAPGGFTLRTDIDLAALGSVTPPADFVSVPGGPIWDGDHAKPDPALVDHVNRDLAARLGPASNRTRFAVPPGSRSGLPSKGTVRVPVILVDFADAPHQSVQTASEIQSRMFGSGDAGLYPMDSLRNYYQRSSYGQLTVQGDVCGWYRSPWTRAQYEQSARNYEARWAYLYGPGVGLHMARSDLVCEVLQQVDSQIDFSKYDNDNDGDIDGVYIKYAGDARKGSMFWACQFSNFNNYWVDGKRVDKYVTSWYAVQVQNVDNAYPHYSPRIDIHETGHLMGLPDYYDYDLSVGPDGHVGGWDMMGGNWGDHNAFSKYMLGWLTPTIVAGGARYVDLPPATTSGSAVLIMPGAALDSYAEFFIAEYREPGKGNDERIVFTYPGGVYAGPVPYTTKGLFLWHVDARLDSTNWWFASDNSYTPHKLLRFMEADGKEHLERNPIDLTCYYDQNDIYTPGRSLGPTTVPNSNAYDGRRTDAVIDSIQLTTTGARARFAIAAPGTRQPFNGPHAAPCTVQAEDYDSGGPGLAYADTTAGNAGGAYRADDVDIEAGASGRNVGFVIGGEYLTYSVTAATAGEYTVALRASNPDAAAKTVTVSSGTSSTPISLASTGSFDTYRVFPAAGRIRLAAGNNVVKVAFGASRANVDSLTISAVGPSIAVVPTGTALPRDTNNDGRYEDVNGNGRRDFADVVLFFNQMSWIAANEPIAAFDFNANGRIDFADVVWLFNNL